MRHHVFTISASGVASFWAWRFFSALYSVFLLCVFVFLLNPNMLGFKVFVCVGDLSSVVLILGLFDLLENGSRSEFLGVLLLPMILPIIMRCGFHWLHSQVTSTFFVSFQYLEVLVVCLALVFQLLSLYLFLLFVISLECTLKKKKKKNPQVAALEVRIAVILLSG
jgi:hypothetical protein